MPFLSLATWGDVLEQDLPALITELRSCSLRMEALRKWVSEAQS